MVLYILYMSCFFMEEKLQYLIQDEKYIGMLF